MVSFSSASEFSTATARPARQPYVSPDRSRSRDRELLLLGEGDAPVLVRGGFPEPDSRDCVPLRCTSFTMLRARDAYASEFNVSSTSERAGETFTNMMVFEVP